jgi:hypothetical protein
MSEERVILSEKPEDLRKAVEWGREQQQKNIFNELKRTMRRSMKSLIEVGICYASK